MDLTVRIHRYVKRIELLAITLLVAYVVFSALYGLHNLVLQFGIDGTNQAFLATLAGLIGTCAFSVHCLKALSQAFPHKAAKWIVGLLVALYGVGLGLWFVLEKQLTVDVFGYFHLTELLLELDVPPIVWIIVNTYVGPLILVMTEVGCAFRLICRTDVGAEQHANQEGIKLPYTNGEVRALSLGKSRRLGIMRTIRVGFWTTLYAFISASAIVGAEDGGGLFLVALLTIFQLICMRKFSDYNFEYKYRRKGGALKHMMFTIFVLIILALLPGSSLFFSA